jgi:hypothetical protein
MKITETGSINERKHRKLRMITALAREINGGRRSPNSPLKAARAAGYVTARSKRQGMDELVYLMHAEFPGYRPSRSVREAMLA